MIEPDSSTVCTIGHSNRSGPAFLALLQENGIQCLVDVRRLPGSRACPQFDREQLHQVLHRAGIAYVWAGGALGGRRGRTFVATDRRNGWWHNTSFRHYADYACGAPFAAGLRRLERRAARARCVIMCAEAVWWRCHRRIITDHLLAHGHAVVHIMGPNKAVAASMSPGARCRGALLTYPPTDTSTQETGR